MKPSSAIKKKKTIGILGGMGPVSSAHFYYNILRYCQTEFHASQDGEYPPMILYSLPLQEWDTTGFRNTDAVLTQIISALQTLEQAGADFIVIPCNTTHFLFSQMSKAVTVPILHMLDLVIDHAKNQGYKKIGLLATESTVKLQTYHASAEKAGIFIVVPDHQQQASVTTVIGNVEAGRNSENDTRVLCHIAQDLHEQGADAVILGCTELPVAMRQSDTKVPLLDSSDILAQASARYAYGKE